MAFGIASEALFLIGGTRAVDETNLRSLIDVLLHYRPVRRRLVEIKRTRAPFLREYARYLALRDFQSSVSPNRSC